MGVHVAKGDNSPLGRDSARRPQGGPCPRGDIHERKQRAAALACRRHQPHPLRRLHRRATAPARAGALLLPRPLVLRRPGGRGAESGRLQAHRGGRALGHPQPRGRWRAALRRERVRAPWHAVLPQAAWQRHEGIRLPLPPVELHAERRSARRAAAARRAAGRPGQRRHAGRLQSQGTRPDQVEGRHARRRGVCVVRPRRRTAGGLPGPDHHRIL